MKAIVLAAGFGTRMGALSASVAKPLLPLGGGTVLNYLVSNLFRSGRVDSITVVSNHYYIDQFRDWAASGGDPRITVLDDGAISNETRLGAIADMDLAVRRIEDDGEPVIVMAGDNIYGFEFAEMIAFQERRGTDVAAAYRQSDLTRLRKTGVASLGPDGTIAAFDEKPAEPASDIAVPCLYIFTRQTLLLVSEYLAGGNNGDAPGYFMKWLHSRVKVTAFLFGAPIHSIGDYDSYMAVVNKFGGGAEVV